MADEKKPAKKKPAKPTAGELVARFAHRYRYQLAPLYGIAGVIFLGAVAHESPKDGWLWIVATSAVIATVFLYTRKWLDRDVERIYAAVGIILSTAWLLAAWKWGVTQPLAIVAAVVGVLLGIPWWSHFRIRRPARATRAEKAQATSEAAEVWNEYVAQPGQALPGSWLQNVRPIKHGWQATIVLPRGEHTTENAVKATDRVTSAYGMPVGSLSIEATSEGIGNHALLTVLNENPLHKGQLFKAPSLDPNTGVAHVGVYGDGELADFRFWMPKSGPVHSLVSGTTGSGKSRFLDQLLAEARHSGLIVTWMIDPQGGQSLPRWVDSVDWAALSSDAGLAMLQAAHDVMHARSRHLARMEYVDDRGRTVRGIDFFDPTPEFPLLMLVLEEAHDILRRPSAANGPISDRDNPIKLVEDIGKMGRKCGVFVVLATQMPSVKELGESSALRSMVSSGNVVVFRTSDRLTGGMAFSGALPVDPSSIQRSINGKSTGGMGYIVGSASRTVMMRAFFVEDPYEWANSGTPAELDALSVQAAGPAYLAGRNRTETGTDLAVVEHPRVVDVTTHDDEPAWQVEAFTPPDEPDEAWVDLSDFDLPEPDEEPAESEADPLPAPLEAAPTNAPEAVYAAIVRLGGRAKTIDLVDATPYKPRTITAAANTLIEQGLVVRVMKGLYEVTTEGDTTP